MKTLILIFTMAAFNMSFAITMDEADCGLSSNYESLTKNEVAYEATVDRSSDDIVIESSEM